MSDSIKIDRVRDSRDNRLGYNVIPIHYDLFFDTDFKTFEYFGKEEIKVEIRKNTKEILLNANKIKFLRAKIISKGIEQDCVISPNQKKKTVKLHVKNLVSGTATISIDFTGKNNDEMYGFYRSSYKAQGGHSEYILASQF